jgi:hypothetical protein
MFERLEIPDIDLNFDHRIENTQLRQQLKVSETKNKKLTNFLIGIGIGIILGWIGFEIHSLYTRNRESKNKPKR